MKRIGLVTILAGSAMLTACASSSPPPSAVELHRTAHILGKTHDQARAIGGSSKVEISGSLGSLGNPVRADMPAGQRDYLSRLTCQDGSVPTFYRVGSFDEGPYGNMLDGYEVDCPRSGPRSQMVYLDMYHSGHRETTAVPGFQIRG